MKIVRMIVVGSSALLMLAPAAFAQQQMDITLKKIPKRPVAVEQVPDERRAEQEVQRATRRLLEEEERTRLVEVERKIAQRVDRESILRDVRQQQTIRRALR